MENDIWGRPYMIVMKRLGNRKPVIGIKLPRHLDNIVHTLFPPALPGTALVGIPIPAEFPEITAEEVRFAARALPNGKTPGPDGIPNEILKAAALQDPQRFANTFNSCLAKAHYPPS